MHTLVKKDKKDWNTHCSQGNHQTGTSQSSSQSSCPQLQQKKYLNAVFKDYEISPFSNYNIIWKYLLQGFLSIAQDKDFAEVNDTWHDP